MATQSPGYGAHVQDRLRIGVIAPPWLSVPPEGYGGTEAVVDQLCRGLAAAGHDVTLVAHPSSTCPVRVVPVLAEHGALAINDAEAERRHVGGAYAILRDHDVIHDHTRAGTIHARDVGVPVVVTNHGPFDVEANERLAAAACPSLSVVAVSEAHALGARGVRVDAVIHHGVDVDSVPWRRPGEHLLFLGRMSPDKGVHLAVRYARDAGVPLLIAAKMREAGEREYYRREIAPNLGAGILHVGEIGGRTKLEMLASARALLNPLCWPEPFGMVMIEAMACGTPVIARRCGSTPEIVAGGTGFVVDDDDGFRRAIRDVGRIDRAAVRAHVARSFSTARMVERHVALYRAAIARTAVLDPGSAR